MKRTSALPGKKRGWQLCYYMMAVFNVITVWKKEAQYDDYRGKRKCNYFRNTTIRRIYCP